MSYEDSLSQSMLASENVKDRPLVSNVDVSSLLNEIEALQKGLEDEVCKKGSSSSAMLSLKPILDKIKTNLTKVNQELIKEKTSLSELKISFSQSLSQLEPGLSQNELKVKAAKLVSQQKRLLSAFKVQKILMGKIKETNHNNVCDTTESFVVTESRAMVQTEKASVTVQGKEGEKNSVGHAKLISSIGREFKETDRTAIAFQGTESQKKSVVSAKVVHSTELQNAKSTRQFSQILENLSKAIAKNNPRRAHNVVASVQTVKGFNVEKFSAGNNVTKTTQVFPLSVATPFLLPMATHGGQSTRNPMSATKITDLQQDMMPKVSDMPQRSAVAQNQPIVPQGLTIDTLPGNDKLVVVNVKHETQKMKPAETKKQPRKAKPVPAKKAAIAQKSVAKNNKQNPKQGITSLIQAMKRVGKVDDNTMDVLPSLRPPSPKRNREDVDVSLLKFVVTMKDEEFLQSSNFLPEDFWEKNFDEITVDKTFLNKISFDEW